MTPEVPVLHIVRGARRSRILALRSGEAGDVELLERLRNRDEEAFRHLFRRYGGMVRALAQRIVRRPFLADEILQETFLILWRNPHAYRPERGSFRAWLASTAHHRAVDVVRREESQRRRAHDSESLEGTQQPDIAESVVEDADLADRRVKIRLALRALPERQREVLELMYFSGQTQSMIATRLNVPLGTVKSRSLLGMQRLRSAISEKGR